MLDINLAELLRVTLRAFMSLVTLFLITKMLGKKQVSEMSLFDYVIGISIGNFAAEMTINLESHFLNGTLAVVIFGLVAFVVSVSTMKSIKLRRYFMGVPTIVIQDGQIIYQNMKKIKYDVNDLLQECRVNGCFDISEINYAIMETNGKISILLKSDYQNPINKDMKVKKENPSLCACIIIDGKIMYQNLDLINKTSDWLKKELKVKGKKLEDILLATLDNQEKLIIYEKNVNIEPLNVLE